MNDSQENDGLWELLGSGPRPVVSPFFARNVLRAVRRSTPAPPWFAIPRWAGAAALAVLVIGFSLSLPHAMEQTAAVPADEEMLIAFDSAAGIAGIVRIEPIGPEEFAGL